MFRSRVTLPIVFVALCAAALPAALQARSSASGSITVIAGLPRELAFKISPAKITSSPAVFKVTNKGKLPHSFKVCTKPTTNDTANSCTGVATKVLAPGATAMLSVKLVASGKYEYLSGSATQAASGMKGIVTVLLATTAPTGAGGGTATPVTTTTAKGGSGTGSSGGVVNGAATDASCPAGTTVPVGAGAGDQDDDNEGGFPTDGDGCL
jgi:hypothetical protein